MESFYQISEFARIVDPNKHPNTVDNWFKALEDKGFHYINRVSGAKVYDDLDVQIAQFIREKRDGKPRWSLDAIFDTLSDKFTLRPFPKEETTSSTQFTSGQQLIDLESIKNELRNAAEQIAAAEVAEIRRQYEEIIRSIPAPVPPEEERRQRMNYLLTEKRVMSALEREALQLWNKKPMSDRMTHVGLFRQVEDVGKRDRFIDAYVSDHLEERFNEEFPE